MNDRNIPSLPVPFLQRLKGGAKPYGMEYEFKMAGLLALRARRMGMRFQVFTNVASAKPFDDLVVRVLAPEHCASVVVVQMKHANDEKPIALQALTNFKGFISLQKYFEDFFLKFRKIHSKREDRSNADDSVLYDGPWENIRMMIFTNRDVPRSQGGLDGSHLYFPLEDLFNTGSLDSQCVFSFGYEDTEVWHLYKNEPREDIYQKQFLPRLRIFRNQAHANDLDDLIRRELDTLFGAPLPRSKQFLYEYIASLKRWALDDSVGHPLSNDSGELEDLLLSDLATQAKAASGDGVLIFEEKHCSALEELLEGMRAGDVARVEVRGVAPGRRAAKLLQVLERRYTGHWAYVGDGALEEFPRAALEAACAACHVLVVDVSEEEEKEKAAQDLVDAVGGSLKVVFLTEGEADLEDDWRLLQLTREVQEKILDASILFQGSPIQLRDLEKMWPILREVDGSLLCALAFGEKPVLGAAPPSPDNHTLYLPRTLDHPIPLDQRILVKLMSETDVLALTGVPRDITSRRNKQESRREIIAGNVHFHEVTYEANSSRTAKRNNRWAILSYTDESSPEKEKAAFTDICEKNPELNLHWVQCIVSDSGGFSLWLRRSQGSQTALEPFMLTASATCSCSSFCIHAAKAAAIGSRTNLLVGEPGMGKTNFLKRLATECIHWTPGRWVVFVQALDHRYILQRWPKAEDLTTQHLVELLAAAAEMPNGSETASRCLEAAIFQWGEVDIFIDGVDEVCPAFKDKIIRLLDLMLKTHVHSVWVSSRPEIESRLSRILCCPASYLRPFTKEEQKSFLCSHWSFSNNRDPTDFELLANEMVDVLHSATDRGDNRSLLDIPLHIQMAAEAFEDVVYSDNTPMRRLSKNSFTLFELYRRFVDKKRDFYRERYGLNDAKFENIVFEDYFNEIHQNCAMLLLVYDGEYGEVDTGPFRDFISRNKKTISKEKTGILWLDENGNPNFAHYTFVEFFAASWLFSRGIETPNIAEPVWRSLLSRDDRNPLRQILEHLLAEGLPVHQAVLDGDQEALEAALAIDPGGHERRDQFGRRGLHLAASLGRANAVGALLAAGCDPRSRDALLGWTPLRYCVASRQLQAAEILLEAGADPADLTVDDELECAFTAAELGLVMVLKLILKCTKQFNSGNSKIIDDLLLNAAESGHHNIIKVLLQSGGNVDTRLFNETLLIMAVQSGDRETVSLLLEHGADVGVCDKDAGTALHYAASKGHHEIVKLLLLSGAAVNVHNKWKKTPLMYASESGDRRSVSLLLEHGADVFVRDCDAKTVLHYAARGGHYDIIKLLIDVRAEVNVRPVKKATPLMYTARRGDRESVSLLLEHGAEVAECNENADTALHWAAWNGHHETMELLLDCGANIHVINRRKETPLMNAAQSGKIESVSLLLRRGAVVSACDVNDATALYYAALNNHYEIIKLLLNSGANANECHRKNETPLMLAVRSGNIKSVSLLLRHGADVNQCDFFIGTALHYAAWDSQYEIMETLLKNGAQVNVYNRKNETPLILAARTGTIKTVSLLLTYGADITSCDDVIGTALHNATKVGDHKMIKLLLDHGADANVSNRNNETPLMNAMQSGDRYSVALLLERGADGSQLACEDNGQSALHNADKNRPPIIRKL